MFYTAVKSHLGLLVMLEMIIREREGRRGRERREGGERGEGREVGRGGIEITMR